MYHSNPEYRQHVNALSRRYYRESHPVARPSIADGLLKNGHVREIEAVGIGPIVIECYTMKESGRALDVDDLTIKRWISSKMIPQPLFRTTHMGWRVFTRGELEIVCNILADHKSQYRLFRISHTEVIAAFHEQISEYRKEIWDA